MNKIISLLALLAPALLHAQEKAKQPSNMEAFWLPMIGMLAIMYLFIFRPQQKKAKEQQDLIAGLKAGDEVITTGGLIGRVKSVADQFVTIDAGSNSALKVLKTHVGGLTKPKEAPKPKEKPKK